MQYHTFEMQRFLDKPSLGLLILILLQIHTYRCCIEEERRGLIEIKAFLKSNNENADRLLPSWIDDETSDCCGWERVGCDKSTGHVTDLSLNDLRKNPRLEEFRGYNEGHWQLYYQDDKFWLLNVSLFLPFKELRSLDLTANSFDGWIGNEGFERLSSLKLETLNISANEFNKNIMESLGTIASIKTLALSKINLDGSFHIQELAKLKHLEMLDVSDNLLGGSPSMQDFQGLVKLKKLTILDLSNNLLHRDDLQFLSAFKSLETLSLGSNALGSYFPINELSALENLKMLDLSETSIRYSLTHQGSQLLSRLKKLETLDLSYNYLLTKAIIPQLSALKSLKNLIIRDINSEGPFPAQELSVLENLVMLDLSANRFSGSLTLQDSKSLLKLSKLEHLDLTLNNFDVDILKSLGSLPALKSLSLARNDMKGLLSGQDFKPFSNLEILELWANNFTGIVPPSMWKLQSLKSLSLARNKLSGPLPIQGLCGLKNLEELDLSQNAFEGALPPCLNNLTSLRQLDLSHNRFEGSFSFSSLANLSKLEIVSLVSDHNKFEVETEYPSWVPMFQLKILVLSRCNLKMVTGSIPEFLRGQSKLIVLDLSHNNLKGRFPNWLFEKNAGLKVLRLRNNSLVGQIHVTPYPNKNFLWMDVSDNQLDGNLQENLAEMVPHLIHLNLSTNVLEGDIPSSIGKLIRLNQLDMSSNHFSGELPKELVSGCSSLYVLKLSNNKFQGELFSTHFNLSLLSLHADKNEFTGTLSNVITRSPKLSLLDVSYNDMSGGIPSWIGNMTSLRTLILHNNFFGGQFPCELVLSGFFDVSDNDLSGSLPSCNNLQHLEHVHLQGNRLTGSLPDKFLNSSSLLTLDIRNNNLTGSIPDSIASVPNLRILLLGGNHFSGFIPQQFCLLTKISLMDLSKNSFSGYIPSCFDLLNFGKMEENSYVFAQGLAYPNYGLTIYMDGYKKAASVVMEDWGYDEQVEVEFITKNRPSSYKGDILNYMSGLDLSWNNLSGEIPSEVGKLSWIHALNLSHNRLTGPIPKSFSNLAQLESLDLSYNKLSGEIPSELIGLNFLAVFSVAYNNLSGRTPDMTAQFGTFGETSYDGNPLLCGELLKRECNSIVEPPYSSPTSSNESEGKWYDIDPVVFSASFTASYVMILLGFATVLYINPYWRGRWFNLIEEFIYSCYDFASASFCKLSARLYY